MKKSAKLIILAIILITILCCSLIGTYALWKPIREASQTVEVPSEKWNPSLPYIVFAGFDGNQQEITDINNIAQIAEFAVVGYTGTVEELDIPSSISITYQSAGETYVLTKTVTRIITGNPISQVLYFQDGELYTGSKGEMLIKNNDIISSLHIPETITNIGANAFVGCTNLKTIVIDGTGSILVGNYAFAGCINLTTVNTQKTITGTLSSIFEDTQYVPPATPDP